ncbi:hypothetical protein [Microbacterium imperiale]|uniref:hypothetical protein n=1 Tax=Microbacterium imperiale TaxID=33884 RepID=UPI001AEABA90|nr:hypothetical protein [Microbacterium imperiale]MBP2421995.1 pyruvate/2-oxoglutarate dehydrogenase complex dihydrolipoamide acyltransferase (E2) component [Microbacterium imperiale]MDS0200153.1 hypothetical protein [Microbacterium imperiale]
MLSTLSSSAPALVWRQADADFYVATLDGQYAGFVTTGSVPATFDAESGHGADLGAHTSPEAAAAAVADAAAPARSAPSRTRRRSARTAAPRPRRHSYDRH